MTQYYICLSDFNSGPKTETFLNSRVDKSKTQLGIYRGTVYVLISVKISLTGLQNKYIKLDFLCQAI